MEAEKKGVESDEIVFVAWNYQPKKVKEEIWIHLREEKLVKNMVFFISFTFLGGQEMLQDQGLSDKKIWFHCSHILVILTKEHAYKFKKKIVIY